VRYTRSGARVRYPYRAADVRARERRNGLPIHGYTGANGGGKTMLAVYDALPSLAAGKPIVSTCRILDPITGDPHPLWVPLDDFRLLLDVEDCEVIADEVTGVASARDAMALPSVVNNHIQQLRKADVTFRWTTPDWARADVSLRRVTQGLTTMYGFMAVEAVETTRFGSKRRWRQSRAFLARTYDARKFDEWSMSKERSSQRSARIRPVARQLLWGPGAPVRDMYETFDHAITVGAVNDSGVCLDCGGHRRRPSCTCSTGGPVKDASPGMRRWALLSAVRERHQGEFAEQHAPGHSEFVLPETDDTPGVLVSIAEAP
jgi:hypothetical protein